jgi:hypothetical protein
MTRLSAIWASSHRAGVVRHAAAVLAAAALAWMALSGIHRVSENLALRPTRCEIAGLLDNCPLQKTLKITRWDGMLLEVEKRALVSPAGCFERAIEYRDWCGTKRPIVARFFRKSRLIETRTFSVSTGP